MNRLIELQNIQAGYGQKSVLKDVNLTVYERDFLGVIGPNGGGKTTLMRVILGLLKPSSGKIQFYQDDQPVSRITIGYLPQYSQIDKKFPISVHEVILSGLYREKPFLRDYTSGQKERVSEVITQMGLEGLEKRQIGELSGGQLQRVLLGRAIVQHPQVVILDEPNTYLDMRFEERLYQLLNEINRESAIILVSHDIGTILQNVKTVACVNETLDYHPDTRVSGQWLEERFGCPIELLGHGHLPHRILGCHHGKNILHRNSGDNQ